MSTNNVSSVRKVITAVWLAVVGIQFVIWLVMCVVGWHLPFPFWLWTAAVGGVIVGGMWAVTRHGAQR